jgi:hypothetical protein
VITSDTPETDAAVIASGGDWSPVLRETCRRLERERDEARDQLIHLRSCVYDVIHSLKAGAFDELEKAWKEGLK